MNFQMFKLVLEKAEARGRAVLLGSFTLLLSTWVPEKKKRRRKGRGTRDHIANISWIIEKAREFQKNIYFCFIDYAKAFDCVDHNELWKILKDMGIPLEKPICRSGSNS